MYDNKNPPVPIVGSIIVSFYYGFTKSITIFLMLFNVKN